MKINVKLKEQSYDIILEDGALSRAGDFFSLKRKVLVVTDDAVPRSYAEKIAAQCSEPIIAVIEHGERSKCFEQLEFLLSKMLSASFTRDDCVIAVGGGVVGDLSGFAASCYMRGIDFYNAPTTLLSQVDSSIGGKTAIDFGGIKNSVGAFYQPKAVLIDPAALKTLEKRQFSAGLAEVIKIAATCDCGLFSLIERSDSIDKKLLDIIFRALCLKRDIVQADPKEHGMRRVLNFGHTVGHAIESYYGGSMLHGECVALGMLPMCSREVGNRIKNVLQKYGLPTIIKPSAKELMPYLVHDKKAKHDIIQAVFVSELGTYEFCDLKPQEVYRLVEDCFL